MSVHLLHRDRGDDRGQHDGADLKLFCFPWSGAGKSAYRPLAEAMPSAVQIVSVQPPAESGLDAIADSLAETLAETIDDPGTGRFAFFGHSLGALMAYAVARRLPVKPEQLILSASRSPATPPPVTLHELPDEELDDGLARMGGMSPERLADKDFMARFRPRIRADLATCETYRAPLGADSSIDVPITAWAGRSDWYASPWLVRQWRHFAGHRFELRQFDGDHFFINDMGSWVNALLADLTRTPPVTHTLSA
ncbi:MAG TPA: alpha/beta fold hydrolase [Pseudonocardia sp.]|uniref:thioesterase II family protein n=1 Tax=Pseudonocardia sp. TaxID=60912 RepID=UPI002F3E7C43